MVTWIVSFRASAKSKQMELAAADSPVMLDWLEPIRKGHVSSFSQDPALRIISGWRTGRNHGWLFCILLCANFARSIHLTQWNHRHMCRFRNSGQMEMMRSHSGSTRKLPWHAVLPIRYPSEKRDIGS